MYKMIDEYDTRRMPFMVLYSMQVSFGVMVELKT